MLVGIALSLAYEVNMNRALVLVALAAGCGLINTNTLSKDYDFDVQKFSETIGDKSTPSGTLPKIACTSDASCNGMLPVDSRYSIKCDTNGDKNCMATAEVRLPFAVDLQKTMTSLPPEVLQLSIDHVSIKKIAYWVSLDLLNVAVPKVELWVAPATAADENDPRAVLVGTMASLPAMATACADPVDPNGDVEAPRPASNLPQVPVCDLPLTSDGTSALASFVKQAANPSSPVPFQVIAHAVVTVHGGDPIPSGQLEFALRPTVTFSLLK